MFKSWTSTLVTAVCCVSILANAQTPSISQLQEKLNIAERTKGPEDRAVSLALNDLAFAYYKQGNPAKAEPLFKRGLAIDEKTLGNNHPDVVISLNNLAEIYRQQGRYTDAIPLYQRAVIIKERNLRQEDDLLATLLSNLALCYQNLGDYRTAEPLSKRSIALKEQVLGRNHPSLAAGLNNLGSFYLEQKQYGLADPLLKRALSIQETSLGPQHASLAFTLTNLGLSSDNQGNNSAAESFYQRAIAIREQALGPNHPDLAATLINLASVYSRQNKFTQAESLYKRSIAIYERAYGPNYRMVADALNNLASGYKRQQRHAEAELAYKQALAIKQSVLGNNHREVADIQVSLSTLYQHMGNDPVALNYARKATAIYANRIATSGTESGSTREAALNEGGFHMHLYLLARNPTQEPPEKVADESLQVLQLAQTSGTAGAISRMAARFARNDDDLGVLVKRRQDITEAISHNEARLLQAISLPPEKRNPESELKVRNEMARMAQELGILDQKLQQQYPEYRELVSPSPINLPAIKRLLHPREAMLVFGIGKEESWAWVVRSNMSHFIRLDVTRDALTKDIADIRNQMSFNGNDPQPVDVEKLHRLYLELIQPTMADLAGVEHLMVVPDGPLQSLPLSMLVASPPASPRTSTYGKTDWLIKHYALSVLPSVTSIRAFRQFAQDAKGQEPFAGFGDPILTDGPSNQRSINSNLSKLYRNLAVSATGKAEPTGIADVDLIRQQASLPDTANEIRAMSRIMRGNPGTLWLRERATETNVKSMDLSRFRVLAFATHGVMAGEIGRDMEPGLLLTPPKEGSLLDDGYLSAGEISQLKLNADWILLSACNTAAPDGTPGAEGLSGMAKAFFYAGARSLLVSHWPIASEATVPLTTGMLRAYESNPAAGKAQAQRTAVLALMNTAGHPEYAHPVFWAPFVVVGEGGAVGR